MKFLIHITLLFSVFFSSSGFWVNSHYCQGELASTSFFISFEGCCSGEALASCSGEKMSCSNEGQEEEDGCCHNEPIFYKLFQNQELKVVEFKSIERLIVLNTVIPVINIQLASINKQLLQFSNYTLPLIAYDRQVRFQTFLC